MKSQVSAAVFLAAALVAARPAGAIPIFAHQYEVSCTKCHSVVPHLNAFGAAFLADGERIPGVQPAPGFPVAAKINLVDSSAQQGTGLNGAGLPKAIVDEVEVFLAGSVGTRASYFLEQYVLDGGMPGATRDAWVIDRVNPWNARIPVAIQAGSFTLPVPVDPETFRESAQHYSIFDQTVGANPFHFFDPKIGGQLIVGNPLRGASAQIFAGPGHDKQSGLPTLGTDTMQVVHDAAGRLDASAYRYAGTRPTAAGPDSFWRIGYGLAYNQWGRLTSETVLQTGWDSTCGVVVSMGCSSSGGFTQLRYQLNRRLFTLARYEGTTDPLNGLARDTVVLFGYGPAEWSRLTIEDVIAHTPLTTHTMNLQFTFAY